MEFGDRGYAWGAAHLAQDVLACGAKVTGLRRGTAEVERMERRLGFQLGQRRTPWLRFGAAALAIEQPRQVEKRRAGAVVAVERVAVGALGLLGQATALVDHAERVVGPV